MADGAAEGLVAMEPLDGALQDHGLYHAARADLLRRLDRRDESAAAYRRALQCPCNDIERRYLEGRLRDLSHAPRSGG